MKKSAVPNWVWAVLMLAHLLGLGWALKQGSWNFPDSDRYIQAAANLKLHHELYARPWPMSRPQGQAVQEHTIRPVGYPLMVLVTGASEMSPVILLVVQNLLSLLAVGGVLLCWGRCANPKTGDWVVASIGILSFPAQFIYANAVMSEIALQAAVLVLLGAGLWFIRTQCELYFWGVASAAVIALLLKPVFCFLAVVVAGFGVGLAWRLKQGRLALIGVVPLVVLLLYMGWNKQRTGYFHYSSIAEINMLHYNAAGVVRQTAGAAAEEQWVVGVLREANQQPDFASRQQLIQARAVAILWKHPVVYARQHVQGMAAMFLDPGRFDISQFLGWQLPGGGLLAQARSGGLWKAVGRLPLGMLGVLGVVALANAARLVLAIRGFRRLKHGGPVLRYGRWLAVALLLYVALLTGPLGAARFLVPVWPLLLGLALIGWRWEQPTSAIVAAEQLEDGASA